MSGSKVGGDCCGDRYEVNCIVKCKCGCETCYCRMCYFAHCQRLAEEALASGWRPAEARAKSAC